MKWDKVNLANVAEIYSGYAFKSTDLLTNNEQGSYPIIKIKNVNNRKVSKDCDTFLPERLFKNGYSKYFLQKGDILIAMTGQGSVGRIGKMPSVDRNYLVNQRVGIVRINSEMANPEFVYQQIANAGNEKYYFDLAFGAGQPNLSPTDIGSLGIKLPHLRIQQRIAAILSAYDDLIENNLRRIQLLEEAARCIYKSLHEKGSYKSKKAGDVLDFVTGKLNSNAAVLSGEYPFFTCGQEVLRTNSFSFDTEAVLLGGNNASARYPVFYYKGKFDAYQRTYIIRPKQNTSLKYLYFFWESKLEFLHSISTGAATKFITLKILNDIDVPIIPEETEREFEKDVAPMFELKANLEIQNIQLRQARDILLPKLMSGEIEI